MKYMMSRTSKPEEDTIKYLGVKLDKNLWKPHILHQAQMLRLRLTKLQFLLQPTSTVLLHLRRRIYQSVVRPIWMYGCEIWASACDTQIKRVQTVQNRALRLIANAR